MNNTRYAVVQGSFWMSYCIILSYASVYLLSRGFSNSQIGIIIAIAGLLSAILQPVVAGFADKVERIPLRYFIGFFSLIMIIVAMCLGIPTLNWLMIAVFYGLLLAILQILTPLIYALGMQCINRGIPINFGLVRGLGSLAYAGISFVAGNMILKYDTTIIPLLIILTYSVLFIAGVTFCFPKKNFQKKMNDTPDELNKRIKMTKEVTEIEKPIKNPNFLVRYRKFFVLLSGITLLFIGHNILNGYTFQIVSYHNGGSREMGIVIAIAAAIEVPTMMVFSLINRKISCNTLLKISGVFFAIKAFLTWIAISISALYLIQITQLLGFALFVPTSVYYVNQLMEDRDRIKGQAFMTMTNTLGSISGSLCGGFLLDRAGVSVMLLVTTIVSVAGAFIVFFTTGRSCAIDKGIRNKNEL